MQIVESAIENLKLVNGPIGYEKKIHAVKKKKKTIILTILILKQPMT
jgi:hypothetical protein